MQQNIIDAQYMTPKGKQAVRKLNKEAKPLSIRNKNNSMNMKSKKFPTPRRSDNATTNVSPKSVAKPTKGRPGAGRSIGKKTYGASRVTQVAPKQQSMTGSSPIKMTVSTQPKPAMGKMGKKMPPSYARVKQSLRRTMGYS